MGLFDKEQVKSAEAPAGELTAKQIAAQKFKERRAQAKEEAKNKALKLRDELSKAGLLDRLTPESKAYVIDLCAETVAKKSVGSGAASVFTQLFGANPVAGTKVTLNDAFKKTFKGKSTIDIHVKKWATKGVEVSFTPNSEDYLQSVYTLVKLA